MFNFQQIYLDCAYKLVVWNVPQMDYLRLIGLSGWSPLSHWFSTPLFWKFYFSSITWMPQKSRINHRIKIKPVVEPHLTFGTHCAWYFFFLWFLKNQVKAKRQTSTACVWQCITRKNQEFHFLFFSLHSAGSFHSHLLFFFSLRSFHFLFYAVLFNCTFFPSNEYLSVSE